MPEDECGEGRAFRKGLPFPDFDRGSGKNEMSVTQIEPPDFENADVVIVYSDEADHDRAKADVEGWAREHGFERSGEHWLARISRDGKRMHKGFCFRPESLYGT